MDALVAPDVMPLDASSGEAARAGDESTRRRVAELILRTGPCTAAHLAEELGLTTAGVRRHLAALEEAGALVARAERVNGQRGRGRPARVFALTDAGRAAFGVERDDLAVRALDFVAARLGAEAVDEFADQMLAGVESRFAELDGVADPVDRLVQAFTDCGYPATQHDAASGRQLCQHHCPIALLAKAHPQLCLAEGRLISRLLGTHVQRLSTIALGDDVCTTHIPRAHTEAFAHTDPEERKPR